MPTRERVEKSKTASSEGSIDTEPRQSDASDSLKDELDTLLDEIDEVLEENAEEFVKGYVQKGGE